MKPVNLMSAEAVVADASPSSGNNLAVIVGVAIGVAVLGGGGYMGMARVDSIKSEAAKATADQTDIQNEITSIDAQIVQLGQTATTNQSKEAAKQAESAVVSSFQQRLDYITMLREIRGLMPSDKDAATVVGIQAGGSADSAGGTPSSDSVATIRMFARDDIVMASLVARLESSKTLKDVKLTKFKTHRPGGDPTKDQYWEFLVTATIDRGDGAVTDSGDGSTVSSGGSLDLALTPTPRAAKKAQPSGKAAKTAPVTPAEPVNPFDTAAKRAGGGA